jgi:hypothetical protein
MLAGLLAGVLGFTFGRVFGEPAVDAAIAFESYVEYDVHHEAPEPELVSRSLQSTAGLGTGTLIYGIALGGMFSLVFAAGYGRLGQLAARGTAALIGVLGVTAIYLVPFLKYPANPPSVGDPDTIGYRTLVYLLLVLVSILAMVLAVLLQRRLVTRFGGWNGTLLAIAGYIVIMAIAFAIFPSVNEVPQQELPTVIGAVTDADVTFPPSVLWAFRVSSIGIQVVIWTTIALVFGALAERQLEPAPRRVEQVPVAVPR